MQDTARVLAGECSVDVEGTEPRHQRGEVIVVVKPDNTVLVHDASGYQPAAWLTRADSVQIQRDEQRFTLEAIDGEDSLRVESHSDYGFDSFPVSPAGPELSSCPDCESALVRDGGRVVCVGCLESSTIPRDATVHQSTCSDCGFPEMTAERGETFEICVNYDCQSLSDAASERFDGEWSCPDCNDPLEVRHERGLQAICEDCNRGLNLPAGIVTGRCDCGLPIFETATDTRCLDTTCDAESEASAAAVNL